MEPDLRDLLAAVLSGIDPGEERRGALLSRLQCDDLFRQSFVAEIHLLGRLKAVQAPEPRWLRLEDELGWSARRPPEVDALERRVMRAARGWTAWRRAVRWVLGLTVVAVFLLSVAWLVRVPPAVDAVTPAECARATQIEAVVWPPGFDDPPSLNGSVRPGRLQMVSGRLTLTFTNGVMLSVEGPADLDIQAVDRVFCQRGHLRARVPAGAEGFTVLAAGYEVVDLGTEFGLNAEPDGTARLMVFEGQASVSILGRDGLTRQSALLEGVKSVRVDTSTSTITDIAPRPELFVRSPMDASPALDLHADYPEMVAAARPWSYWRFQTMIDGRVPNEVAGRPALLALGGVQLDGAPGLARGALFRAGEPEQAFLMDSEWSPSRTAGYALELWVRGESLGQSALVSLIDRDDGKAEKHVALLELSARSRWSAHEPCSVRFLDRWPPASLGGVNVFSRRNYRPDRWHHLVGQNVGGALQLYIDGLLVGLSGTAEEAGARACSVLVGRLKLWPKPGDPTQWRTFEGRLTELAFYDRPLTPEEILQHARGRGDTPADYR